MNLPDLSFSVVNSRCGDWRFYDRLRLAPVRLLVAALTALVVLYAHPPASRALEDAWPWMNKTVDADFTATDWMAQLPDDLLISELSIPGTHESHSFYGGFGGTNPWCSICQRTSIHEQLKAGVRALDIRIGHHDNALEVRHGPTSGRAYFDSYCWAWDFCDCGGILVACSEFLRDHPGETILIRVAPCCGSTAGFSYYCAHNSLSFSEAIDGALAQYAAYVYPWPISDCGAMPTLGEVRGKIVILQDFVGDYSVSRLHPSHPYTDKGRVLCAPGPGLPLLPHLAALSNPAGLFPSEAVYFLNMGSNQPLIRASTIQSPDLTEKYTSVCMGDFNGDLFPDLALLMRLPLQGAGLSVFLMNFQGQVMSSWFYLVGYHTHEPWSAVAADFDNDGDVDIAWTDNDPTLLSSNGWVRMLRNQGPGLPLPDLFVYEEGWFVGREPYGLAVADLDDNPTGGLDLVTTHRLWNVVKGWTFDMTATTLSEFGSVQLGVYDHPEQVIAADFGSDGPPDEVAVSCRSGLTRLFRVDDGLGLVEHPDPIISGGDSRALAAADVDGDGDQDVIVADVTGSTIGVWLNDGNFQFPESYLINVGARHPVALSTGDFDHDFDVDIAVTEWGPGDYMWGLDRAYILWNRGNHPNWGPGKSLGPYWGHLCIQDFFDLNGWSDIPVKIDRIKEHIDWARDSATTHPESLFVNFLSGVDWHLINCNINPSGVAYRTNGAANQYLFNALNAGEVWRCGIIMADFPGAGLIDAVIGHNRFGELSHVHAGLPGVAYSAGAWGDYDNDGDLDILLTGQTLQNQQVSALYRNDAGAFTDTGTLLTGVDTGSTAWGDYDNDGDLDILLTGWTGSREMSRVYRNDAGSFSKSTALIGVSAGAGAWGDYDNDGDLDVLLVGGTNRHSLSRRHGVAPPPPPPPVRTGSLTLVECGNDRDPDLLFADDTHWQATLCLYRNDAGRFTDIDTGLPGVTNSSVAWGDYDNDGDLDFVLTGDRGDSVWYASVYRNDEGVFHDVNAGLLGVRNGSAAWGDYDNDGDLDLVLTGNAPYWEVGISHVYRNEGGTFTDIGAALKGVINGSAAWGDHDNDGDLDILLTGASWEAYTDTLYVSRVYQNNGGSFAREFFWILPVSQGSAVWGDYDADGDLDILVAGNVGPDVFQSVVYRNDHTPGNTPPSAPTNLSAQVTDSTMTFSWDAATDAQTPSAGLTYNLRVGTTPGGDEICSAMAASEGYRRIAALGNVNHNTSWTIRLPDPPCPVYYWSVQALDASFAGSAFAAEQTLEQTPDGLTTGALKFEALPTSYALHPVAPNPFGAGTTIRFDLPGGGKAKLEIFNVMGRRVRTLVDGQRDAGRYAPVWDGRDAAGSAVSPGVYFVRLTAGDFSATRKVVRTR